jgi:hypothetical protein
VADLLRRERDVQAVRGRNSLSDLRKLDVAMVTDLELIESRTTMTTSTTRVENTDGHQVRSPWNRAHERWDCDLRCRAESNAWSVSIRVINISESGIGFVAQSILELAVGSRMTIVDGPLRNLRVEIAWSAGNKYGAKALNAPLPQAQIQAVLGNGAGT